MRVQLSALSGYVALTLFAVFVHISNAFPTFVNVTIEKRESSTATTPPSTIDSLLKQLRNPAEVLAVLLLVGGDVVQKAIAQVSGHWFTPVSFSFGWVGYAFSGLMSVFGDGLLMPESDMVAKIIDLKGGNIQDNESWVLGRLIRDMELEVERYYPDQREQRRLAELGCDEKDLALRRKSEKENYEALTPAEKFKADHQRLRESPLLITWWLAKDVYEKKRMRKVGVKRDPLPDLPHRDIVWWSYVPVIFLQFSIAITPMRHGKDGAWRVLFITAAGNFLALVTGSLSKWKTEKFACRMAKGPKTFILTRGNSHRHAFVVDVPEGRWSLQLEDLSIRQRRGTSYRYQALFVLLTAAWVLLLITIGGLEDHTWFLFGVGLLGMAHNVLVAGVKRHSNAHGIPLEFVSRDEVKDPHNPFVVEDESIIQTWPKNNLMRALMAPEKAYTGVGYRLLPIFFPGDLYPGKEEEYWKGVGDAREVEREAKRKKQKLNQRPKPTTSMANVNYGQEQQDGKGALSSNKQDSSRNETVGESSAAGIRWNQPSSADLGQSAEIKQAIGKEQEITEGGPLPPLQDRIDSREQIVGKGKARADPQGQFRQESPTRTTISPMLMK